MADVTGPSQGRDQRRVNRQLRAMVQRQALGEDLDLAGIRGSDREVHMREGYIHADAGPTLAQDPGDGSFHRDGSLAEVTARGACSAVIAKGVEMPAAPAFCRPEVEGEPQAAEQEDPVGRVVEVVGWVSGGVGEDGCGVGPGLGRSSARSGGGRCVKCASNCSCSQARVAFRCHPRRWSPAGWSWGGSGGWGAGGEVGPGGGGSRHTGVGQRPRPIAQKAMSATSRLNTSNFQGGFVTTTCSTVRYVIGR